uniref:SWIM-type domain-containing protein n=1 Tax=Opuntia streptacantha TaxID=393608 RepID=A0A7C9D5U2_OPUST
MDCEVDDKQVLEDGHVISIVDNSHNMGVKRQVVYNTSNHVAHCSCKKFECEGIPYRHILCVLKGKGLRKMPNYYILNRWTKTASSKSIFDVNGILLEACSQLLHEDMLILHNWLEFLNCMRIAGRDPKKLGLVRKRIQNVLKELKELDGGTSKSKISELESFIGSSASEQIDILPPK